MRNGESTRDYSDEWGLFCILHSAFCIPHKTLRSAQDAGGAWTVIKFAFLKAGEPEDFMNTNPAVFTGIVQALYYARETVTAAT